MTTPAGPLDEAIVTFGKATAAITALASSRGYAVGSIPQDPVVPYWSFALVPGGDYPNHLLGASVPIRQRVQVNCVADSRSSAAQLSKAWRDALNMYSGTVGSLTIESAVCEGEYDMPEPRGDGSDRFWHKRVLEFSIGYR